MGIPVSDLRKVCCRRVTAACCLLLLANDMASNRQRVLTVHGMALVFSTQSSRHVESPRIVMAELSLAIIPLFNNAIDCFRHLRVACNSERDMETYQLRLDIAGRTLSRWGKLVALDVGMNKTSITLTCDESGLCEKILTQVNNLFKDASGSSSQEISPVGTANGESPTYDLSPEMK